MNFFILPIYVHLSYKIKQNHSNIKLKFQFEIIAMTMEILKQVFQGKW